MEYILCKISKVWSLFDCCYFLLLRWKLEKKTYLPIGPLCLSIARRYQRNENFAVADSEIESVLPVNAALDLMYVLGIWKKKIYSNPQFLHTIRHVTLVVNTGTTILVPNLQGKSLQLIWTLGTHRFHLQVPNLQIRCRDLTAWQGTRIVVPVMAAKGHCPLYCHDPFNSLTPGSFEWYFGEVIFKLISVTDGWGISQGPMS